MLIGLVLPAAHPWRDAASSFGTVAWDGEVSGLSAAARAPMDLLLLDASEIGIGDVAVLRAYRIARPATRCVVSLPETAQPGSPLLAALVGMGIYDLAQGLGLADALARRANYADAARWHDVAPAAPTLADRRRPLNQRPLLIVVVGAGYGAGTTTLARAVAETTVALGHLVLLIDAALMPGATRTAGRARVIRAAPLGGHLATSEITTELHRQAGGYIVVDAGRAGETAGLPELAGTADAVLLAVAPLPHRLAWAEALFADRVLPDPTSCVVIGGTEAQAASVAAGLKGCMGAMAATVHHLSRDLTTQDLSIGTILGERLLPAGRQQALPKRLRWKLLSLPAVAGSVTHLLGTVVSQAALVLGRMVGVIIVAAALALIVVMILPVLGPVHAAAQVLAWVHIEWQRLTTFLP